MAQCSYLGHIVGNGKVYPGKNMVQAVENFPFPRTKKAGPGIPQVYRLLSALYTELCMYCCATDQESNTQPSTVE